MDDLFVTLREDRDYPYCYDDNGSNLRLMNYIMHQFIAGLGGLLTYFMHLNTSTCTCLQQGFLHRAYCRNSCTIYIGCRLSVSVTPQGYLERGVRFTMGDELL